jgi:hypothetical protein
MSRQLAMSEPAAVKSNDQTADLDGSAPPVSHPAHSALQERTEMKLDKPSCENRLMYAGGDPLPGLPLEREKERLPKQGMAPQKQRGQEADHSACRLAGFYPSFGARVYLPPPDCTTLGLLVIHIRGFETLLQLCVKIRELEVSKRKQPE